MIQSAPGIGAYGNVNVPPQGIPPVLAAALAGALPQAAPMRHGQGAQPVRFGSVPNQPLQQIAMPNMSGQAVNNYGMVPQPPNQPTQGAIGQLPGYGQVQGPNIPALQQQPASGLLPWLRGMFSGPPG